MKNKYDCLIIGGGPAGLMSAYYLIKNGIKNICILEKHNENYHKACAGLLTIKAYNFLKEDGLDVLKDIDYFKMDNVSVYYKNDLSFKMNMNFNENKFHWVSSRSGVRIELDKYLKKKVKDLEVTIKYNIKIKDIHIDKNIVYTNERNYEYNSIIFADGTKGYSQKYLSRKNKKENISLEVAFKDDKKNKQFVNIYFGITEKGYAWYGSTGENINIGFTDEFSKSVNYNEKLKEFGKKLGYEIEDKNIKGAFLPCGIRKFNKTKHNMYFIGDSGGYADSLTAEGLYYSFKTAKLASNAITENNRKIFDKGIKPINRSLNSSYSKRKYFFNKRLQKYIWGKLAKKHSNFITYAWTKIILDNKYSYSQILKCYLEYKRIKKGGRK